MKLLKSSIVLATCLIFDVHAATPPECSHATALAQAPGDVTPLQYGAKADGVTDDTVALNKMYAAARASHAAVFLRGRKYKVTGRIDARGVSSIGEGASLIFALSSATSSNAFTWGGNDTFVTDVVFDLSNSGPSTMQGIYNGESGASNQRFYRNRVVCETADGSVRKANIYGAWFAGTDLTGLYVEENQFERCSYGVQLNNQQGLTGNVRTAPLGKPSQHIHIFNNTLIDSTIGINTPHLMVSDVVINGNTIEPKSFLLDLPLNVAHASKVTVFGNTVTSNANSSNGTLHIEDASGSVAVTGNSVTVEGVNNGIEVGVQPSASKDIDPTTRVVVSGNHVEGAGSASGTVGILLPDRGTVDATIANNYVAKFSECINSVGPSNISSNTVASCVAPIKAAKSAVSSNVVRH